MLDVMIFISIILLVGIICSFIIGVYLLYKYYKTKNKKYLWLGLLLTFIIPGILIVLFIWWYISSMTVTCYVPLCYVPQGNVSALIMPPLFIKHRDKFVKKFKNKVSQDVFNKITKKKK